MPRDHTHAWDRDVCLNPSVGLEELRRQAREAVDTAELWISNSAFISKINVARHSCSHQAFEQIKTWLDTCDNEHSDCCPLSIHVARPRRLLRISFRENCLRVNLVDGSSVFKTFKDTVDDNKEKGVSVKDLLKTFQDAIDITWKLGIRHIWIDSMCIVQGDPKEWRVESTKMGDIYGSTYLVIVASMGSS
ncbi:uncharacterized protein RAG0_17279 [Rhynchosporium agropyri]|uniref:Heterokaryon incompatibility domain-containing protein n=1 Tax=Rhynchosporium agropyri TaxID=914238 RepID=A0A1E1LTF6_9HELO|nr:uncharacterized protein RAG0_17279 [Rhynchosporium agropyri]